MEELKTNTNDSFTGYAKIIIEKANLKVKFIKLKINN